MIERSLITERSETYLAHEPGLAAGTLFNGLAAASTSALAMTLAKNDLGKGIRIGRACRALIVASFGSLGSGLLGEFTAWVSSSSEKADGASMYQLPGFSITYTDVSDHFILKGELDLRGVTPPAPVAGDSDLNLWIKHVGTGVNVAVTVTLMDFERIPTAEILTTYSPATIGST